MLEGHARAAERKARVEQGHAKKDSIHGLYDLYDSDLGSLEYELRGVIPGYDEALAKADVERTLATRELQPKREFLRKYIERELDFARFHAVAVELGGPGSRWAGDFTPGFFERTYGLTLADIRTDEQRTIDSSRNHEVIPGDMFQGDSLQKLEEKVGPKGVHLFMERLALFGMGHIPTEPVFMGEYLRRIYRLQAEKGIVLAQLPLDEMFSVATYAWITKLRSKYPGKFSASMDGLFYRLQRLPGAPDELPLLSVKEFKRVEKLWQSSNGEVDTFKQNLTRILE